MKLNECQVLCVDDDPIVLQYMQTLLEKRVQTLLVANDGEQGLGLYKEHRPQIVIVDNLMPKMSGLELAQKIKEINPQQHIILFTGFEDVEIFKKAIEIGISGYEKKPLASSGRLLQNLENIAEGIVNTQKLKKANREIAIKNNIINKHLLMTISDLNGVIVDASDAMLSLSGYTKEELIGQNHQVLGHNDDQQEAIASLWDALQKNQAWSGELQNQKKDGESFWVDVIVEPLFDDQEQKYGYIAIKHNITDKKRIEFLSITDTLTQLYNKKQFNTTLAKELKNAQTYGSNFALVLLDLDYFKLYNEHYGYAKGNEVLHQIGNMLNKMTGKASDFAFRIGGEEFAVLLSNIDKDSLSEFCNSISVTLQKHSIEHKYSKIADCVTMSMGGVLIEGSADFVSDDELYAFAEKLLFKAKKEGKNRAIIKSWGESVEVKSLPLDSLTKLPTRPMLIQMIAQNPQEKLLLIINVANFQQVNTHFGAKMADSLLLDRAKSYRKMLQSDVSTLFRLSLSEFALLVTKESEFDRYILMAKHYILDNSYCDNVFFNNNRLFVNQVIGAVISRSDILNKADRALKQANALNRSYFIYDESMQVSNDKEYQTIEQMSVYKDALENGRIIPYFQPIVDAKTAQVYKYEALARIVDIEGNILSPYLFLEASKKDRTSEFFARQLLQKIFNIYSLNPGTRFSINLTYENICSEGLREYILNRLEKFGGKGITFEIIESEEIEDYKDIEEFIALIKPYGCSIAIDDFGSGYSNLAHLMQLNPDYLKLDGTLIQNIDKDPKSEQIVKSLLTYTQHSGNKVVAEFVSNESIANKVIQIGIDLLQGYYYGKPEPATYYGLIQK
jgi:diguanylate cyclase (GGDEF)-like protein/PAS domain S-box-containing protein